MLGLSLSRSCIYVVVFLMLLFWFIAVPRCALPSCPKLFNLAALIWKQIMKFLREPL